jgi:hypothetical protein
MWLDLILKGTNNGVLHLKKSGFLDFAHRPVFSQKTQRFGN